MKKWFVRLLVLLMLMPVIPSVVSASEPERIPAFPGAEGGGMYTTGGRDGKVYYVTTLADSGPGSLRDAVSENDRTIIFNVGGTIHLQSPLKITGSNLTIAGQTAPGDGIAVVDHPTFIEGDNIIIRFLRFRLGDANPSEDDALGGRYLENIIIDHSSFSWSVDEVLSVYGVENLTIQWSIISEAMHMSQHVKGKHGYGGIWGGQNASFHHNLIAHNSSRNPAFDSTNGNSHDFRNNVIYNWGHFASYGGKGADTNLINNYYKPGPETQVIRFMNAETTGRYFIEGNVMEGYPELDNNNWDAVHKYPDYSELNEPRSFDANPINMEPATVAYERVLAKAGAILPYRDAIDARIVNEVKQGTGVHLNSQDEVGGVPQLAYAETDRIDTDGDGIPDEWENANGLDPNEASDANTKDSNGYTYLELYLNSIVADMDLDMVTGNPQVSMITPDNHTIMDAGDSIDLTATAGAENNSTITKVEFYANGDLIGESTQSPYTFQWNNVDDGTYFIIAKAIDDIGRSTDSSTVVVHANTPGNIAPWTAQDIGAVGIPGHTQIDEAMSQVTVKSAGNIGGREDAFQFAYQPVAGNVEIVTKIENITPTDSEAQAGIMFRANTDSDAPFVALMIPYLKSAMKGVTLSRDDQGASVQMIEPVEELTLPYWIKLIRINDQFTSLISEDGADWKVVGSLQLTLPEEILVGLAADASKSRSEVERYNTSVFSHTSVTALTSDYPVPPEHIHAQAGDQQVSLTWDEVAGATGYNVKVSQLAGGPYTTIATNITDNNFTHTDLTAGMTYYYVISSLKNEEESFDSEEVDAVPTGALETIYYINHDFENMAIGSLPENYIIPQREGDDHKVSVEEVPENSIGNDSNQAIRVYDNAADNMYFELNFPQQLGAFVIEFDYMSPSQPGTSAIIHVKDGDQRRTPIMVEIRKPQVPAEEQYTLVYKNKGNQDVKLSDPLADHQWYNFKLDIDVTTNLMDIYLDHVLVAEQVEIKDDMRSLGLGMMMMGRTPGGGKGTMYFDNIKVYKEPIPSPSGLVFTSGDGKVQLDWQHATGAMSYTLKRSEVSGGPYTTIAEGIENTTFIDEGLTNDKPYYYVVIAVGEFGESGPSNEVEAIAVEIPALPPAPASVNAIARSTQADISWREVDNATHYTIYRKTNTEDYRVIQDNYVGTSYRDGGLVNGQAYDYVITASNIGGEGEQSTSVTVQPMAPLQTPEVTIAAGDQQVTLQWLANEDASFTISRSLHYDGPYTVMADDVQLLSYTDHTVENGVPYYYKVQATHGGHHSLSSAPVGIRAKMPDGTPDAPTNVTALNMADGIQLSWDETADATSYHVYRRLASDEQFALVAEHVEQTFYLDEGLSIGDAYEYTVSATNGQGEGFKSGVVAVSTTNVIVVAGDGSGDFTSVQAAVDSIASNNTEPYTILIYPGEYREKVDIYRKHNIALIGLGESPEDTVLIYDDSAKTLDDQGNEIGTNASYSLRAEANDITAVNLSIVNDAGQHAGQAVALAARGDRQIYSNVRIIGWQDTLLAEGHRNRQYYVDSYIDGDVDYIFGSANAVFMNSVIHSKAGGYITAASTQEGNNGYFFINSRLTAEPGLTDSVHLGRTYRPYAHVVLIDSWVDDHIRPAGWHNWGNPDNELTARYAEYNSQGDGATPDQRHTWSKQLTLQEAEQYTVAQLFGDWQPDQIQWLLEEEVEQAGDGDTTPPPSTPGDGDTTPPPSVLPGDGSSQGVVYNDHGMVLDEHAAKISEEDREGMQVLKALIPKQTLTAAIDRMNNQLDDPIITVDLSSRQATNYEVSFAATSLRAAIEAYPKASLNIRSGELQYDLPLQALEQRLLSTQSDQANIKFIIAELADSHVEAAAHALGANLASRAYEFNIVFEHADGTEEEIKDLGYHYATRVITLPVQSDLAQMTAVWLDEDEGMFRFVPAQFRSEGGTIQAHLLRPSNSVYAMIQYEKSFADMDNHWAKDDVELMASKLIVKGKDDATFAPADAVSRAQFATMLMRALGLDGLDGNGQFTDVQSNAWYANAAHVLSDIGIVQGFQDHSFRPDETISREQMATMISRAIRFVDRDHNLEQHSYTLPYEDANKVSEWAEHAVWEMRETGIMHGIGSQSFAPARSANRAEATVIIKRLLAYFNWIHS